MCLWVHLGVFVGACGCVCGCMWVYGGVCGCLRMLVGTSECLMLEDVSCHLTLTNSSNEICVFMWVFYKHCCL